MKQRCSHSAHQFGTLVESQKEDPHLGGNPEQMSCLLEFLNKTCCGFMSCKDVKKNVYMNMYIYVYRYADLFIEQLEKLL